MQFRKTWTNAEIVQKVVANMGEHGANFDEKSNLVEFTKLQNFFVGMYVENLMDKLVPWDALQNRESLTLPELVDIMRPGG